MDQLISRVTQHVVDLMSKNDASHDQKHIERVVKLAKFIESKEKAANPSSALRSEVIELASLLHDVGDHKYLKDGEDGTHMVENLLIEFGAPDDLAEEIQEIVSNVSYTHEKKDPAKVQQVLLSSPELAVVQDADRLDALGAIGMARCFAYNSDVSLQNARDHFSEKLITLTQLMKTKTGGRLAIPRTQRTKEYSGWFDEELALES